MTTTCTWLIENCVHDIDTGGITSATWRINAADGAYYSTAYGTCSFTYDVNSPTFKPYDQVTEQEVLDWCWAGGVDKDAYELSMARRIEAQKNPTTATGTPWSQP